MAGNPASPRLSTSQAFAPYGGASATPASRMQGAALQVVIFAFFIAAGAGTGWLVQGKVGAVSGLLIGVVIAWAVRAVIAGRLGWGGRASAAHPSPFIPRAEATPKTSLADAPSATKSAVLDGATKSGFYPVTKTARATRGGDL